MTLLGSSLPLPILFTIFHISCLRFLVVGTDAENNVSLRRLRRFHPVGIVLHPARASLVRVVKQTLAHVHRERFRLFTRHDGAEAALLCAIPFFHFDQPEVGANSWSGWASTVIDVAKFPPRNSYFSCLCCDRAAQAQAREENDHF
jgi:hypothetical protein